MYEFAGAFYKQRSLYKFVRSFQLTNILFVKVRNTLLLFSVHGCSLCKFHFVIKLPISYQFLAPEKKNMVILFHSFHWPLVLLTIRMKRAQPSIFSVSHTSAYFSPFAPKFDGNQHSFVYLWCSSYTATTTKPWSSNAKQQKIIKTYPSCGKKTVRHRLNSITKRKK